MLRLLETTAFRLLTGLWGVLAPLCSHAVLLASGDGTGNDSPIPGFDEYNLVGTIGSESGTYLGDGWVLTANHVGTGDFVLGGTLHKFIPGTEYRLETSPGSGSDLLMFEVYPAPALPGIPIRSFSPIVGQVTFMIGHGRNRGTATSFDPNGPSVAPPPLSGWHWGVGQSMRWGINVVSGFPAGPVLNTVSFLMDFDEFGGALFESQATVGDSGGPVFIVNGFNESELAGIMIAVFGASGQPSQTSLYTNGTAAARLDFYRDQILNQMAVPEPSRALPTAAAALALLARRRNAQRGAATAQHR
jgi:hypothetical protein